MTFARGGSKAYTPLLSGIAEEFSDIINKTRKLQRLSSARSNNTSSYIYAGKFNL
jgi:hypothetical protein